MAGSGKTTLAKYIYNATCRNYENMSFLEDIGRRCKESHGLLQLQQQLLNDILGGRKRKIPSVSQVSYKVYILGSKKINAESKIIITSRENTDNWFDFTCWRCQDYPMKLLTEDESLTLLSRRAFGSNVPMEGFEKLTLEAVQYCEGNPLALLVLASSLSNKDTIYWKSQLNLLEKNMDSGMLNVVITSYNSLPFDYNKELFLHIVCFFVGKDKDYVVKILEDDCFALSGIKTQSNRCLISVSPDNKLMMYLLDKRFPLGFAL